MKNIYIITRPKDNAYLCESAKGGLFTLGPSELGPSSLRLEFSHQSAAHVWLAVHPHLIDNGYGVECLQSEVEPPKAEPVKKFKLGHRVGMLFQIVALRDIPSLGVKAGQVGGLVRCEENLSQEGDCWVGECARVSGDARVRGNALVTEAARVFGQATIDGDAVVRGEATVNGYAVVRDHAFVGGRALVTDHARVQGNAMVAGDQRVGGTTLRDGEYPKTQPIEIPGGDYEKRLNALEKKVARLTELVAP